VGPDPLEPAGREGPAVHPRRAQGQGPAGAAGGLAFINSIGTAGGFAGPALMGWLKDVTGSFQNGLLVMAGIMLVATLLAASLKLVMTRE